MNSSYVKLIGQSVLLLVLQVVVFRNLALFDLAFCFVYVAVLLFLPVDAGRIFVLMLAFLLGVFIDAFYNSLGIHAAALVFTAYVRYYWLNAITPQGGYDANSTLTLSNQGLQWFSTYALPIIFIHHFMLFFVEAGGFSHFGFTFIKALLSSLFTFFVIVIIQILFFSRKKGL